MRLRLIFLISAFFAAGAYFATLWLAPQPPASRAMVVPGSKARVGGPFSLIDHTGKRVTDRDFRGRHMLIFFGYTHCPDICPMGLQTIFAALAQLGPRAAQIAPIFITLDPDRDTPQVLANYIESFDARLVGLTGTAPEIAAVAKSFHVHVRRPAETTANGAHHIDHTSIYYLQDQTGGYAGHFAYGTTAQALAEGIAERL